MSTGEVLRVRAAMKPIATVPRALRTVDMATGEQRSRITSAPTLRGTGGGCRRRGDGCPGAGQRRAGEVRRRSVAETRRNYEAYLKRVADRGLQVRPEAHERPSSGRRSRLWQVDRRTRCSPNGRNCVPPTSTR